MIHVCYGLYDKDGRYSKFVGTSITSVFENTQQPITIHILHDNSLNNDNRDKFNYIAGNYHQQIKFYNVDNLIPDDIERVKNYAPKITKERFSIASMYRLFISKIVDVDRIIYLDADTVVNCDINELWQVNIEDYPLAAVNEYSNSKERFKSVASNLYLLKMNFVKFENYFNSGVLVLNLKYIRNNFNLILNGIKFYNDNLEHIAFVDQDILNYCFSNDYLKLSPNFNFFIDFERVTSNQQLKKGILHYEAYSLNFNTNDVYNKLFLDYFSKTPWFNENIFSHMFESFKEFYNQKQIQLIKLSNALAGKSRSFFTEKQFSEPLKQIFNVQPNEKILIPPPPYRY